MKESLKRVTYENIDSEHVCCALSEKKDEKTVSLKKEWLKKRFAEGLVFLKLDVRGKVFIEYLPAESAFAPIVAPNYMYINCFWVSGKYKGSGHANELLTACIDDAKSKGKDGLVILSSKKKMPFLSDPKYLKYKGFKVCDEACGQYELLYFPFEDKVSEPTFRNVVRDSLTLVEDVVIYHTNQCPHAEKYARLIEEIAIKRKLSFKRIKIETAEEAQASPAPFTTYSLFIMGQFITNEILTEKKFMQLIEEFSL